MEPKDHPTARASLIAALDWARNVDVERFRLTVITFGQRDPVTVGPDRHYWYATLMQEVCNGPKGIKLNLQTANDLIGMIIGAWDDFYHPGPDLEAPE